MKFARLAAVVLTVVALVFASRLELSKDLTTLFPHTVEANMLARVTRAFGGGDVALVLVRGDDPAVVERGAEQAAEALRKCATVAAVITAAPATALEDPTEAWRFASLRARRRLAAALTEDGMRARLRETHALLLAPGAADEAARLARDPLRLAMIPWEDRIEIASGVAGFVTADRRTRLIAVEPRGTAFASGDAARFTDEAEAALSGVRAANPGVTTGLAGGHAVARQTEAMMRGDLQKSGALSVVLAALAFLVTFRRARALLAVLPPLAMGTLWTTALAALIFPELSAVATAFTAVVIGVGVDTGVHVYGRLLRARREGVYAAAAATIARRETWKPTLGAAFAAAGAFLCLLLTDIEGMHQLGVLCAAGEVLTAVAILIVVPELGALLERRHPPAPPRGTWAVALTSTKPRAIAALVLVAIGVAAGIVFGVPSIDQGVAVLDAKALPALATQAEIYATFGGKRGQVMVVSTGMNEMYARSRADAVAEACDGLAARGELDNFDALARLAPSPGLQRVRLDERDRLDLPGKRALLARLLDEEGFAADAFGPALEAFARPSENVADVLDRAADEPALDWLRRRHLAADAEGTMAVTYVRGAGDDARTLLRSADPAAVITGYADLEAALARTLRSDLPRVMAAALGVVVVVLGASLRRTSRILLAVLVLAVEIAIVLALARVLGVRWHVYDALVLPVLLGITLDEVLFLLEAADRAPSIEDAIAEQAPLATATALTTAAGFGALVVCRFRGLVDVGKVGALGSIVGLVAALVVVPAAYRVLAKPRAVR